MPEDDTDQPRLPAVSTYTIRQLRRHMKEVHQMPASRSHRREQIVNVHLLLHRAGACDHTHERF